MGPLCAGKKAASKQINQAKAMTQATTSSLLLCIQKPGYTGKKRQDQFGADKLPRNLQTNQPTTCPTCGKRATEETFLEIKGGEKFLVTRIRCSTYQRQRGRGDPIITKGCPIHNTRTEYQDMPNLPEEICNRFKLAMKKCRLTYEQCGAMLDMQGKSLSSIIAGSSCNPSKASKITELLHKMESAKVSGFTEPEPEAQQAPEPEPTPQPKLISELLGIEQPDEAARLTRLEDRVSAVCAQTQADNTNPWRLMAQLEPLCQQAHALDPKLFEILVERVRNAQ